MTTKHPGSSSKRRLLFLITNEGQWAKVIRYRVVLHPNRGRGIDLQGRIGSRLFIWSILAIFPWSELVRT